MTPPRAVVFDCDGVLVDSEPHSVRSWMMVLADLGHPASSVLVESCTGLGFAPTRQVLTEVGPLPPEEELWPRLLDALERSFNDHGLVRFADAVSTLDAVVSVGVPVAVASASPRARLDLTLRVAGLIDHFPVSVSGDDVVSSKPSPDAYLTAARQLGSAASDCWAIEDSSAGVASAVAAGMQVVAVVRPGADRAALRAAGATVVDAVTPQVLGMPGTPQP